MRLVKPIFLLLLALLAGTARSEIAVANPDLLVELNKEERATLETLGMVARVSGFDQIYDVYEDAAERHLPVVVLTDPLFHTFHILYDYSIRFAELNHFHPTLRSMLGQMLRAQVELHGGAGAPKVRQALKQNLAFLSVPLSYIDTGFEIPEPVEQTVRAERELIDTHAGFDTSRVLGTLEDFSQYKPRGHYTRSDSLERFFKAMVYLGRMTFLLSTPDQPELALKLTRQALLLSQALGTQSSALSAGRLWHSIYEPTSYLVGRSEDPLPTDYLALARTLRGEKSLMEWLAQDSNLIAFIHKAESLPGPRIVSNLARDMTELPPGNSGRVPSPAKGMRLMGQRYIPDAAILQELVYDKVGTREAPRLMPMALDVMAVLGSEQARTILIELYRQNNYRGYLSQLDSLRDEYSRLTVEQWNQTACYAWLYALKLQLEPIIPTRHRSDIADFCLKPAYADKTLVTSCGSWTELRHDTILYAKQSYTVFATAVPSPTTPHDIAYVEPKPAVFDQLGAITSEMRKRLTLAGVADEDLGSRLDRFASCCQTLAGIAREELIGIEMSDDETRYCVNIGGLLKDLTTFTRPTEPDDTLPARTDEDSRMAVIADVHTDPNTGQVLEEAVGNPCKFYATIPFYGEKYLSLIHI